MRPGGEGAPHRAGPIGRRPRVRRHRAAGVGSAPGVPAWLAPRVPAWLLAPGLVWLAAGCVPWVVGEGAEPVAPGVVRLDAGLATLSPPEQPQRVLPVPQVRVATGLLAGADAAVAYVPPLTGHGRLRVRVYRQGSLTLSTAVGWGLHGVPDLAGAGRVFAVPFVTGELQASGGRVGRRWYGALRGIVPYHWGDPSAAVLWIAPQAGVELGTGGFRWGPELGVVVPTVHPGDTQLVLGLGGRWRW